MTLLKLTGALVDHNDFIKLEHEIMTNERQLRNIYTLMMWLSLVEDLLVKRSGEWGAIRLSDSGRKSIGLKKNHEKYNETWKAGFYLYFQQKS